MVSEDRKKYGLNFVWDIKDNVTISNLNKVSVASVVTKSRIRKRARIYYDKLCIKSPSICTMVNTLSGGNQQKVIFGRWILTEPDVFLLDEPTRGIDVGAKYEIYQLIMNMAGEGKSVIMVSSEMPELLGVCDRILVMSGGRLAGEVNAEDTTQEEIMTLAAKYV